MAVGKYVGLADELRKNILSGRYGMEGGLPSAKDIAVERKLAINTVKTALTRLEGEGLIVKRNVGYYVNNISITMTQYSPPSHVRYGDGYSRDLRPVERISLPEHLASKIGKSQPVVFRMQVSGNLVEGQEQPMQISSRYYLLPISDEQFQHMQNDPTFDPMWIDWSVTLETHDESTSRFATSEELAHLKLASPAAVTSLLEVTSDPATNDILMILEAVLSPRVTLCHNFLFENKPTE